MLTEVKFFESLAGLGVGGIFAGIFLILFLRKDKELRDTIASFQGTIDKLSKGHHGIRLALEGIKTILLRKDEDHVR